jgi:hypothetical protein
MSMVVAVEIYGVTHTHSVFACGGCQWEVDAQSALVLMLVWKKKGFGGACPRELTNQL